MFETSWGFVLPSDNDCGIFGLWLETEQYSVSLLLGLRLDCGFIFGYSGGFGIGLHTIGIWPLFSITWSKRKWQ